MPSIKSLCSIVYFDGGCPVCSREVGMYRRQPGADALRWVDVALCAEPALGADLTREAAMARLHLRRADGSLVSGARAFTEMWRALPRWAWLGRLLGAGPALWLLEASYCVFLFVRRSWRKTSAPTGVAARTSAPALVPVILEAPMSGLDAMQSISLVPHPTLPAAVMADLRTDQAGEAGAVRIYQGVLAITRDPALRAFALRHLATERSHLQRIEAWLPRAHRSRLLTLWRAAGWITGALPALLGPRTVYCTIEAVERFVALHYTQQIEHLASHTELAPLRQTLIDCQGDELAHRIEAATARGATPGALLLAWGWLVGAGSRGAVAVCRHI